MKRKTMRKRVVAKLRELKSELRRRLHHRVADVGKWLKAVLCGHYQYYGVPNNHRALATFRWRLTALWRRSLRRRSQRHRMSWPRMQLLADRWLPLPRITHPWPNQRLRVITRGRSPVR